MPKKFACPFYQCDLDVWSSAINDVRNGEMWSVSIDSKANFFGINYVICCEYVWCYYDFTDLYILWYFFFRYFEMMKWEWKSWGA
jgi:hypothetical protein